MSKLKKLFTSGFVLFILFVVVLALVIPSIIDDLALSTCVAKYDTPACNERLAKEKAETYKQAMEKR